MAALARIVLPLTARKLRRAIRAGRSPVAVGGGWYVVRDDGVPASYPPAAREELVESRLKIADLSAAALRTVAFNHVTGETAPGRPAGALGGVTAEGSREGWLEAPIEQDPAYAGLAHCPACKRTKGDSHLGTCPRSAMHGGCGIVGYRYITSREVRP